MTRALLLACADVRATVLWSVAWTATSVLCGIKVWQALTQHDDELED